MSLIKTKSIQLGWDLTPTNNFTIYQPATPDGTFRIATGNAGSTTDVMTVSSSGAVTYAGTVSYSGLGFGTGSATAPSIFPNGDTNTGMYFPTAETIGFSTNGTERLRIDASGNLMVGRTSVVGTNSRLNLQMSGTSPSGYTAASNATLSIDAGTSTNSVINLVGGGDLGVYWSNASGAYDVGVGSNGPDRNLKFATAGAERVRIDSTGKVGINTTAPAKALHVQSTGSEDLRTIRIAYDGTYYADLAQAGAGGLYYRTYGGAAHVWQQNNTEVMRIDGSGRVTTPYQPACRVTRGNVTQNAGTAISTAGGGVTVNIGNCYNNTTGVFTAPVAGTYYVKAYVAYNAQYTVHPDNNINISVNGSNIIGAPSGLQVLNWYTNKEVSGIVNVSANDTISLYHFIHSSQGSSLLVTVILEIVLLG